MPEPRDMHVNRPLTNFSLQYKNEEYIWPLLMPVVKVAFRSDKYWVLTKEDAYRTHDDKIGPTAMANEIKWGLSNETYAVVDHALSDWVAQTEIDNADSPLAPLAETNYNINVGLDNTQEKRVADVIFASASYGTNTTTPSPLWGASSDTPIKDVQDAIDATFMRANTLVFGQEAWSTYRRLPEILDACKAVKKGGGSFAGGMVSEQEVATLFEVQRVIVGRGRYTTSKKGQTATYARTWGKHMAALHVGKPGIKSIGFAFTFSEMKKKTFTVKDLARGTKGATLVKVAWNSDEKVVAADCGYFLDSVIS